LNFFLRFLGDLVPGPNVKKWYFSDLVTKGEKKSKFTFSTVTKSEKYHFFWYLHRSKDLIFGAKKILKNFWKHLVPGTTLIKKNFKLR
jgi:hypothetical protein